MIEMTGILFIHYEQGCSPFLAFQNEKYIKYNQPKGYCKKCGLYFTNSENDEKYSGTEKYCNEGDHEEVIGDEWSYAGLHALTPGYHLIVYSNNEILYNNILTNDFENEMNKEWFYKNYKAQMDVCE